MNIRETNIITEVNLQDWEIFIIGRLTELLMIEILPEGRRDFPILYISKVLNIFLTCIDSKRF